MMKFIFFILISFHISAFGFLADLNLNLDQGGFNPGNENKSVQSLNLLGLFANLGKSESNAAVYLGWFITNLKSVQSIAGGPAATLISTDMGPAIRWQITPQLISLSYFYGIICKGNYTDGLTNEDISGESHLLKFSLEPGLSDRYFVGIGLNYYVSNYKTSVQNNIQSAVAYKNTKIFPSLAFSFRY